MVSSNLEPNKGPGGAGRERKIMNQRGAGFQRICSVVKVPSSDGIKVRRGRVGGAALGDPRFPQIVGKGTGRIFPKTLVVNPGSPTNVGGNRGPPPINVDWKTVVPP